MIYVDNGVINLHRGDDGVLTVPLKTKDKTEYVMDENDYLIFGVKETPIMIVLSLFPASQCTCQLPS